jgi:hypothetical protein
VYDEEVSNDQEVEEKDEKELSYEQREAILLPKYYSAVEFGMKALSLSIPGHNAYDDDEVSEDKAKRYELVRAPLALVKNWDILANYVVILGCIFASSSPMHHRFKGVPRLRILRIRYL